MTENCHQDTYISAIKENDVSIRDTQASLNIIIKYIETFIDETSDRISKIECELKDIRAKYNDIEGVIYDRDVIDMQQYIQRCYDLQIRYPYSNTNMECLKMYLEQNDAMFIYGLTKKIIFDSTKVEMRVRPSYQIEDNWNDFIYISLKLDNTTNDFDIRFAFRDNVLFWGFSFEDNLICLSTSTEKGRPHQRSRYVRVLYDSNKSMFTGIGCSDEINHVTLEPCHIECHFFRTWMLSSTSIINIINNDERQYTVEIKGMVVTA